MKYNKQALSIADQVAKLKSQGLRISDDAKALQYLSSISYYRLRAYTFPFQDNTNPDHPFKTEISFEEIIDLYVFDRQFRLFVLDAIEKIEISFRTQVIHQWAMQHGSHWHLDSPLFRDDVDVPFANRLNTEIGRSTETFIKHYKKKYTEPKEPPVWMSMEVASFGLLSLMFCKLKLGAEKKAVLEHYGLYKVDVLEVGCTHLAT